MSLLSGTEAVSTSGLPESEIGPRVTTTPTSVLASLPLAAAGKLSNPFFVFDDGLGPKTVSLEAKLPDSAAQLEGVLVECLDRRGLFCLHRARTIAAGVLRSFNRIAIRGRGC